MTWIMGIFTTSIYVQFLLLTLIKTDVKGCEITNRSVTCSGANITEIPENIAETTTLVDVEHANIRTLNTSMLIKAENLTKLNVKYSSVSDIVENAFSELTLLRSVSLNGNKLTTLQEGLFSDLKLLKLLELSENELVSVEGVFQGLSSLEVLNLRENKLSDISQDVMKDMTQLHNLELNNNDISEIHPLAFQNQRKLILLGLGSNPLRSIANLLHTNTILQFLNMTDCLLTQFPNDLPSSLKFLNLARNKIQHISKADTRHHEQLNALILEGNGLAFVESGSFAQMKALTDIFLFINQLEHVPGPFPANIKTIHLDNNKIRSLPYDTFQNRTTLRTLSLKINNISTLSLNALERLESIDNLYLEGNPFTVLHDDTFKPARGLKHLNLNHLTLTTIYPNCLRNLDSLTKLMMSYVQVSTNQIHGNIFSNLPKLKELHLQKSPALAKAFLSNLIIEHKKINSIEHLNLEDNGIQILDSDIQTYLPNLQILSLAGNHFICNSNLLWLRNWQRIEPEKFPKFKHVRCHFPEYLQGRQIQDVRVHEFYGQSDTDVSTIPSSTFPQDLWETTMGYENNSTDIYYYQFGEYYDHYNDYDHFEQANEKVYDLPKAVTDPTSPQIISTTVQEKTNNIVSEENDGSSGDNIDVEDEMPKQKKHESSSSLKTVGIAFGMAIGVVIIMLLIAFVVYKLWSRKRQVSLQNERHLNGAQDYVFIASHTNTNNQDKDGKPEPKVHSKLSRAERGSTTSRASEDITNTMDLDMKVYMLDVDA